MTWPADSQDDPLPFVPSFDCAALPWVDGLPLPPDGSLLVFLHHEEAYDTFDRGKDQHARIVHVPVGADTVAEASQDYSPHPVRAGGTVIDRERENFLVEQRPDGSELHPAEVTKYFNQLVASLGLPPIRHPRFAPRRSHPSPRGGRRHQSRPSSLGSLHEHSYPRYLHQCVSEAGQRCC